MPTERPIFRLRTDDDEIVCNLVDLTNYAVDRNGYTPRRAARRRGLVAGDGPYDPVIDRIATHVYGTSHAALHANIERISTLLDRSAAWQRGETAVPVLVEYQPQGSNMPAPWQALVLHGRESEDEMMLPDSYQRDVTSRQVDVAVQLRRRGQWLQPPVSSSVASAVANPYVQTVTFPSSPALPSPTLVELTGFNPQTTTVIPASLLLVSNSLAHIQFVQFAGSSTNWSVVAESANGAYNNDVLRFAASMVPRVSPGVDNIPFSVSVPGTQTLLLATVRANTNANEFLLRASLVGGDNQTYTTPWRPVPYNNGQPQIVVLGEARCAAGWDRIALEAQSINNTGSMDVDLVWTMQLNDATSHSIRLPRAHTFPAPISAESVSLRLDPRPLRARTHEVRLRGTSVDVPLAYQGPPIYTSGTELAVLWLATHGNYWRAVTNTNSPIPIGLKAQRWNAALIPT